MSDSTNTPIEDASASGQACAVPEKPKGLLQWVDAYLERPFLAVGLLSIILIISYQTLMRYLITYVDDASHAGNIMQVFLHWLIDSLSILSRNITWTEELSRFVFIWISYLAIPLAIKRRSNIRVDVVYDKLPVRGQRICWLLMSFIFLTFTAVMLIMGAGQIIQHMEYPQVTSALQIPYAIPYFILPLAFGLMTMRLVQDIYKSIKVAGIKDALIALTLAVIGALPVLLLEDLNAVSLLFGYFVVLLIIGVPVAISLGVASLATILGSGTVPIDFLVTTAFTSIDSFPIMAIPFFIAAGVFMGAGGLSVRLLRLADELLGSLHGGMALATIGTCMFFAAISGSGPATVAAIGSITIPAMVIRGYDKLFAAALVASAGAIGVMIPPSNPFVVYGVSSQVSIGKLFMGGIVPGVLMGLVLMAFAYFYARKKNWKGETRKRTPATLAKAVWEAKWALMVPVIVLGGIYGGLMTPTEAAAVAALYGLVVGAFIHRELTCGSFFGCLVEAAETSAIIIMLMAMATVFGNIMTLEDVPALIAAAILGFTSSKITVLIFINILLLIVGTFMEALAAIVILTPILLPIVVAVGVDPLHFGIIMVMNLAIGFITPPVGVNLFVASGIAKVKIADLAVKAVPMLLLLIICLLFVTYIPEISLFLTR